VALIVFTAGERNFALGFCGAVVASLLLFRLGAAGLMALARRLGHLRRPALRLGLANLHRPGSPAPLLVVSLGVGLTTLVAIAQIEGNLKRQLAGELPSRAPNFYFIDIQPDQAARFDQVAGGLPGVEEVRRVPSLRARVVAVKGVPAEQVQTTPETAWALRGDRGLTYAARPPAGRASSPGSGGRRTTAGRRCSPSTPGWPPAGAWASATPSRSTCSAATSSCASPTCGRWTGAAWA
jgi:putative ABC transport system permease protein